MKIHELQLELMLKHAELRGLEQALRILRGPARPDPIKYREWLRAWNSSGETRTPDLPIMSRTLSTN